MSLYAETAPAVNSLRGYLRDFYRYLCSLYRMRGCFISNQALCRRFGKSHATIQRWLSTLRRLGLIRYEQDPGRTRYIIPIFPLAPRNDAESRRLERESHPAPIDCPEPQPSSFLEEERTPRGVQIPANPAKNEPPLTSKSDCLEKNSKATAEGEPNPGVDVVALLRQAGVPASTAVTLVEEKGAEECLEQLEALPYRKADSPAALLIEAIRRAFAIPAALARRRDAANRAAGERESAKRAQASALLAQRAEELAESRYDALTPNERARLEALVLPTLPPIIQQRFRDGRAGAAMRNAVLGWLGQTPAV